MSGETSDYLEMAHSLERESNSWNEGVLREMAVAAAALLRRAHERERVMRDALQHLSYSRDCGCRPCREQCRDKMALEIELGERIDVARAALAALEAANE